MKDPYKMKSLLKKNLMFKNFVSDHTDRMQNTLREMQVAVADRQRIIGLPSSRVKDN